MKKVPSRLLTWDSFKQSFTFGLTLSSKVPVGNNADYVAVESHKFLIHLCQILDWSASEPLALHIKLPDFTKIGSDHFVALFAGKRFGKLRQIGKRSVDAVTGV